jgi:hypothetical protein
MSFTWDWRVEDVPPTIGSAPPPTCCVDDHERKSDAIATKKLTFAVARGFRGDTTRDYKFFCEYHMTLVLACRDTLRDAGFSTAVLSK